MIRYALICDNDHEFESWFKDSAGFDALNSKKLIECTACNSTKISKQIMSPKVQRTDRVPAEQEWIAPASQSSELLSPEDLEMRQKLAEIRQRMTEDSEDVGSRFTDEARKMHFGDIEQRPIYGRASLEEARELIEDGVGILPIPPAFDERN